MSQTSSYRRASEQGLFGGYIRCVDAVSVAVAVVAGALLALGVLSVVHMVFVRYVMGESTIWQTEFTTFAITASMLLGTPYVLKTGGHVAVTVLPDALQGLPRRLMRLSASLVGLAFCLALTYGCWYYFYEAFTLEWTTGTVWNPPLWPAILPVAVGASLLSLQYVAEILRGET
ncbi:TRAP transporter small permease [Marinobacter sp. 71-i]|uniref:TRAP transporter small permease protein n=1 Tax=Marinobacter iranensis TaxID=2962607 RepID=A0ABT5Y817_9GAMM|nr:TRAP transporter small permease [Marinobacter iranensis]MDF0749823.1 TRAP transporter small permease [Marinobacter iranensis]